MTFRRRCSKGWCQTDARWLVGNATTERLNESWCACYDHVTDVLRYILERDQGWGEDGGDPVIVELSRARS